MLQPHPESPQQLHPWPLQLAVYFRHNLANETWMTSRWSEIMKRPRRCFVPKAGNATIRCETLLQSDPRVADVGMDFPAFNPNFKYNPDSRWWYMLMLM